MLINNQYKQLLIELLQINCVTPMETGQLSNSTAALAIYKSSAEKLGFLPLYDQSPINHLSEEVSVSSIVEHVKHLGHEFYENQPSMVLAWGKKQDRSRTIMINFHMDTVSPHLPVRQEGDLIFGRGAVDMKGPAVAILAAFDGLEKLYPQLKNEIQILIQCVSGEEGGAMGIYGTKILSDLGYIGRLNIFAEPSNSYFFDHATTSMTLAIEVNGQGVTDDRPEAGDNATVILGFMAHYFALHLAPLLAQHTVKMCVAGIHTGTLHNRVYGSGTLLFNFAYTSLASGMKVKQLVAIVFSQACQAFENEYRKNKNLAVTTKNLRQITKLKWVKSNLPVLANRDADMEGLLERSGLIRLPDELNEQAFTCDALWIQDAEQYTVVCGPGGLLENGAHTEHEFVSINDLENYAQMIRQLIHNFYLKVTSTAKEEIYAVQ